MDDNSGTFYAKDLHGLTTGPGATTCATARALALVGDARAVIVVEGVSDQVALETLAGRRGRSLEADGVVILPLGGAHAISRHLPALGPLGANLRLGGLCDAGEAEIFRRALVKAGLGTPRTHEEMAQLGFFVCIQDLESELVRAVGPARVEALLEAHGDLGAFRTLQKQAPWRTRELEAQMRRFLGSGARRKIRYAHLLVAAVELGCVPPPLEAALATGYPESGN